MIPMATAMIVAKASKDNDNDYKVSEVKELIALHEHMLKNSAKQEPQKHVAPSKTNKNINTNNNNNLNPFQLKSIQIQSTQCTNNNQINFDFDLKDKYDLNFMVFRCKLGGIKLKSIVQQANL